MTTPPPPALPSPARSRRHRPPRGPLLALVVLLLVAAGAAGGYALFARSGLVFTNRLAAPVRLVVDTEDPRLVQPGGSVRLTLPRGRTLVAMWELVRPLSAGGRPMGEEVRGSIVEPGVRGTVQRTAAARGSAGDYFAPLITNATDTLLRVTVNAGLEGAVDCGCAVRPGAQRVFIGYYRLYRNSTVQARTGDNRTARFRDFGGSVVMPEGTVGLRFEGKDFLQ